MRGLRGMRPMFKGIRIACTGVAVLIVAIAALTGTACQGPLQTTALNRDVPETASPDWAKLRTLVERYNGSRGGLDERMSLAIQSDFTRLYDGHANDRIGDEALYYSGRISYDLRDYHTARTTFIKHKEQFRRSEFASTIVALEAEMDRNEVAYRRWLEESRGSSNSR